MSALNMVKQVNQTVPTLQVEKHLNPTATTNVVLVHGWGFSAQVWENLLEYLRPHFNVYVLSLPGYDNSEFASQSYQLNTLLNAMRIALPQQSVFCGWSLGANLIFSFAENYPQQVQAIVNIAATPRFLEKENVAGMSADVYEQFYAQLQKQGAKFLPRFAGLCAKGEKTSAQEKKLWVQLKKYLSANDGNYLQQSLMLTADLDNRETLKKLTQPSLHLLAENDALTDINCLQNIHSKYMQVKIVDDASHAVLVSHAKQVSQKIITFVQAHQLLDENKQQVKQSFDSAAHTYHLASELQRMVADDLLNSIETSNAKRVLDIGSGTSYALPALQKQFPTAQQIQCDLAHSMLQVAQNNYAQTNSVNTNFIQADFDQLPFADNSCDLAFSSLAVQWSGDLQNTLQEISRVLTPEGNLYFSTLLEGSLLEVQETWQQAGSQHRHINQFLNEQEFSAMLNQQGNLIASYQIKEYTVYFDNVKSLLRSFKQIGANTVLENRLSGLMGKNRFAQFSKCYEQRRTSQGLPLTYRVSLCKLIKA